MNPQVNHTDPTYKNLFGTNNVGFRLETAGLVCNKFFSKLFLFHFAQLLVHICYFLIRYISLVLLTSNGF